MFYAISYDISDDGRRNSASRILERYGTRVQRSVFECNLTPDQLDKLMNELEPAIDTDEDSLRCYMLCNACAGKVKRLGGLPVTTDAPHLRLGESDCRVG